MALWVRTKAYFAKANTEEPITREDEQQFLELKSEITKYQRTVAPKMPADVGFGADKMTDLLRQSISISHLRGLPRPDRVVMFGTWHHVFIQMCRAVGALKFISEGYTPPARQKGTGGANISDLKKAAAKKGDGEGGGGKVKIVVALVLIAAAVYMFVLKK